MERAQSVVVRFAGDSGDGIQVTGSQFAESTGFFGNDLATFPDYPAEIRAPQGTLAGVSGFQIKFSSDHVYTPGDRLDVLVALNPAALKVNLPQLKRRGLVLANSEAFDPKNLEKAGYTSNPLEDGSLNDFRVVAVPMTSQSTKAVEQLKLPHKDAERTRNFYALGIVYWLFDRDPSHTARWIETRFAKKPTIAEANVIALKAGHAIAETLELWDLRTAIPPAQLEPGRYKNVSGNEATALGLLTGAELTGLKLFLGSYPITPASDILHFLSDSKELGVVTFQAEDEIAAMASTIGAAYGGALAVTTTSGPGLALKTEAMGLAVMLELPMVIVDVQRAGPSTGMPTRSEQSDLMMALFGRHGEAPIPVVSAFSPADAYWAAIEAVRIAVHHMTPVLLLSDGYLANGTEPFRIPEDNLLEPMPIKHRTDPENYAPYGRDKALVRPWVVPGTPGMEHRIGGLEKQDGSGRVSYDGAMHERMSHLRAAKVAKIADDLAPTEVFGDPEGELLVVGWGSTFGAIRAGVNVLRNKGHRIGHVQLRHLNPLPDDLGKILQRYRRVVVPEINLGQLSMILRARYLVDAKSINQLCGRPFREAEMVEALSQHLQVNS